MSGVAGFQASGARGRQKRASAFQVRAGGAILAAALVCALFGPALVPESDRPMTTADVFAAPSAAHWLGTDDAGGDVFWLLLAGTRVSLVVGLVASLVAVAIGGGIGLVAGFVGGRVESLLMRATDVVLVLPALPLAIVLVALTRPGLASLIVVIGLVGWTGTARLVRAQTLSIKERAFVRRARALGASETRILLRRILPHVLPLLAANGALVVSQAILTESTLSFLGLGDPDLPSWGKMLNFALARGALSAGAWWALVAPGAAIVVVVLAASLLGFGLEALWLPRARRNHLAAGAPTLAAPRAEGEPAADALLAVRDLAIDYPGTGDAPVEAVRGVSFDVAPGEVVGLVGESGCGKTTVLMALLGLLPQGSRLVSGSIRLAGRELAGLDERAFGELRGRDLALVYQGAMNALNPVRTVGAQIGEAVLRHAPLLTAEFVELRVAELLERVGIPADRARRFPHELSGGMRQRAVIAMALAASPRLLCADEPTTALDVVVQAQILELLAELGRDLELSVLLVTHDLGVVAELCDRVVVLYGGVVAEAASVEDLFHRPLHPYTRELLRAFPDLERPDAELVAIPGTPPRLDPPPPGCRFAARCPLAVERCRVETPALRELAPGHSASCHLAEAG
jgi:oligopeptide/dipeptide ABC transporter ATP-binding protein